MRVAYRQLASVWREETFPSGHVVFHGFLALAENLSCSSGQRCARAVSCPCQRAILLNLVLFFIVAKFSPDDYLFGGYS